MQTIGLNNMRRDCRAYGLSDRQLQRAGLWCPVVPLAAFNAFLLATDPE